MFERTVGELAAGADSLRRDELVVGLMRLCALLGPRNGHTAIHPLDEHRPPLHVYPLYPYEFADGVFVAAAADLSLVGLEVVAIAGVPLARLLSSITPCVAHDNEWTIKARRPLLAVTSEVLSGLGLIEGRGAVEFNLSGRIVALDPLPAPQYVRALQDAFPSSIGGLPRRDAPEYLRRRGEPRWISRSPGGALHVAYNVTRGDVRGFAAEVESAAEHSLVLDLRHNGGGDNRTYGPLLQGLECCSAAGCALDVLIGRATFSAAMQLVVDLERRTHARFVGEPTGGSPNQYGDAEPVFLPVSGLVAHVATIAWTTAGDGDRRLTREPDERVPLTSAAFFKGRDAVLEAALAYRR